MESHGKHSICSHRIDRIQTTRELFDQDKPMNLEEFFSIFLRNDCTVIMLNEQNKHTELFPEFIEIDNPEAELFPNGSLMGWKHRKGERDYLSQLRSSLLESDNQEIP